MNVLGLRGATTAAENTEAAVLAATEELLAEMARRNVLVVSQIAAIFFTTTPDITSTFPAKAVRKLGWRDLALLGAQEAPAPGPKLCIRVLILWNTDRVPNQIKHTYLREAASLRPDLAE